MESTGIENNSQELKAALEANEGELHQLEEQFDEICLLITNEDYIRTVTERNKRLSKEDIDIDNINNESPIHNLTLDTWSEVAKRELEIADKIQAVLNEVLIKVAEKLRQDSDLPGKFLPIGSTHSGTGVSTTTDFDYIYQLSVGQITLISFADEVNKYAIKSNSSIIEPLSLYMRFADELKKHLSSVQLPDCLDFGGFAQPDFSGVRYSEPAVTIALRWKSDIDSQVWNVPVDITPAYLIPAKETNIVNKVRAKLISLKFHEEDIDGFDIESKLHLVPVQPEGGLWYLTTAVLETSVLKHLADSLPAITDAIKECKRINESLVSAIADYYCREIIPDAEVLEIVEWLVHAIESYRSSSGTEEDPDIVYELREILQDILCCAHVLLPKIEGDTFCELTAKEPLAINSCSIKFHVLNCLLQESLNVNLAETRVELIRNVLQALGTGDGLADHTFLLDSRISQFTVACYCANQKSELCVTARGIIRLILDSICQPPIPDDHATPDNGTGQ
jgi:hypothetical protein